MPQIKAAKKALRVSARRRAMNDRWRRLMREAVRSFRDAVKAGDNKTTAATYQKVQSIIDRAARHHILHPHKAARQKAQLLRTIK
ncbi:MAG TPA: 30S ribosomal protein S20 [Candidatus Andersenbacteria bacterium]|nr:30S ribosomal protein S20 [Candidatus Andersenbacteria bacterium]